MFDFDVGKLLLIGVVALIFIPPKDLPDALRQLGRIIAQGRRMASEFQSQFSEALREAEFSQIKDEIHDLKRKASVEDTFSRVADMLETKVEAKPGAEAASEAPAALAQHEAVSAESPAVAAVEPTTESAPPPEPIQQPVETAPLPEPITLPEASRMGPGKSP